MSERFDWYYEESKWEFDVAIDILNEDASVRSLLEVGCGTGYFLEKVAQALKVEGLEFNQAAVRSCRERGLNVSDTPIERIDRKFDAIVAFEVLEHLSEPARMLAEMANRLNPQGLLIIAVPNPASYLAEADHTLLDMPPHHVTSWSRRTFSHLEQALGLKLAGIHQEPLRFAHYRSYISNYERGEELPPGTSVRAKLLRLFYQASWRASVRVVDAIAAASYQANKELLVGQTHLAVFRK
jgi:SAM-dependent methyltransferase